MSGSGNDDFLSRWSARKLKARSAPAPAEVPETALAPAEAPLAGPPADAAAKTDAEILDELGLPEPDSLMKGDDFQAFLRAGIPAGLRARALRRLWLSDPVLANLDGLNDYEQDFTDKATVRPDLKTAYRVGKGLLREAPQTAGADADGTMDRPVPQPPAEQDAAVAMAEGAPEGAPASAEPEADPPAEADAAQEPRPADAAPADAIVGAPADPSPRPRRMRFRFEAG